MPKPLVFVEMVAFWPLVVGIFALIFRRQVVSASARLTNHPSDLRRERQISLAVTFGAILLIDIGLGGWVWALVPIARPAVLIAVLVIAVPLGYALFKYARAARNQSHPADGSLDQRASIAPVPTDAQARKREPYAGIAESMVARGLVDDADPDASTHRNTIHRLFFVATVIVALGALAIVAMMVFALVNVSSF